METGAPSDLGEHARLTAHEQGLEPALIQHLLGEGSLVLVMPVNLQAVRGEIVVRFSFPNDEQ